MNGVDKIIGRGVEKQALEKIFAVKRAQFTALYGRRRVGKTFLVREFFRNKECIFFQVTGKKDGLVHEQLKIFAESLEETFYAALGLKIQVPHDWHAALALLTRAIEDLASNKKVILFFDELPWLASKKSGLLQEIDYYWNRYWSDNSNLKLIVCGSAASWIIDNLINAKGGLYNRLTSTMLLRPFSLKEVKNYLKTHKFRYGNKQIVALYMVLGGIPHYLSLLDRKLSVPQNINQLCFQVDGELYGEFDKLFSSLFEQADIHAEIVRILAKSHHGKERAELLKLTKSSTDGGTFSKRLKELEEAGFITRFIPIGKQRGAYYKLIDEFSLFHLDWISKIKGQHIDAEYWVAKSKTQAYKIWAGYAFEVLCYKHLEQIRKALKIPGGSLASSWHYLTRASRAKNQETGTQIDLIFDRDDGMINLCEIKYSADPYIIDKQYAKVLLNKAEVFKKQTKIDKDIFFSIISANGLKPTMYSEEIITSVADMADLFK